jgi:tetratricopeptide (TPR) repeat protein
LVGQEAPPGSQGTDAPFRLRLELSDESLAKTGTAHSGAAPGSEAAAKELLVTFRTAAKLQRADPDYHYILGDAFAQLGRHEEAVPFFREAIQCGGEEAAYHQALAKSLWSVGEAEAAADAFREVARLRPEDVEALNALGVVLTTLKHYREAVGAFHSALRLDQNQALVYGNLGVALFRSGRQAEAARAFQKAIQLRSGDSEAHRNLGFALAHSGQPEQALLSFREAIRRRPDSSEGYLDLGDLLYALGRPREALAAYDEAVRRDLDCFRDRSGSRENREAIQLHQLRERVRSEAAPGHPVVQLWKTVLTGGHALKRLVPNRWGAGGALLLILALGRLGWVMAVPYWEYWLFRDRLAAIAGAPVREEGDVLQLILESAREHGLEGSISSTSCSVETRHKWRVIRCQYQVPLRLLPGFAPSMTFSLKVESPFFAGETVFL